MSYISVLQAPASSLMNMTTENMVTEEEEKDQEEDHIHIGGLTQKNKINTYYYEIQLKTLKMNSSMKLAQYS